MRGTFFSLNPCLRFFAGVGILVAVFALIAFGRPPRGPWGAVIRHNIEAGIDATPLFYTEVENMQDLEAGVVALRKRASDSSHP
jgi:hypothetical protein